MEEPVVIVIGGAPGAGKTTLGRALARRIGGVSMTMDPVIRALRSITTPRDHPAFHVGSGGHLEYFTRRRPDDLIADANALAYASWPLVTGVIRRWRLGPAPLVLDWWLLTPERVHDLTAVRSLWLHIDIGALDLRERANEEWREGSADPEMMHAHFMARSRWRNEIVRRSAEKLGLAVIHQPGDRSVDDLVEEAFDLLGLTTGPG